MTLLTVSLPVESLTKSKGAKGSSHHWCVRTGVNFWIFLIQGYQKLLKSLLFPYFLGLGECSVFLFFSLVKTLLARPSHPGVRTL